MQVMMKSIFVEWSTKTVIHQPTQSLIPSFTATDVVTILGWLSPNVEKTIQWMKVLKVTLRQLENSVSLGLQCALEATLWPLALEGTLPLQ